MKKIIAFILLSLFWIVLLFPKDVLWNSLVNYAKEQDVSIFSQKKIDKRYKFTAFKSKIYFQNSELAILKKAELKLWIFYNKIEIQNAQLDKNIPILKGLKIQEARAVYTILSPKKIKIQGLCTLGHFIGEVDIFKRKGYVLLKNRKLKDDFLKQYLKKTDEGMRYEFSY